MTLQKLTLLIILSITSFSLIADTENPLVIIKNYKFVPQQISIKRGQTLRWENHEKRQYHSVWFEALGEEEPDDYLFPEDNYERLFSKTGTFPYRCGPHPEMTGTVLVTD